MKKEKKHKILIIDDIPENGRVLIGILKNEYRINVATDGKTGIELCKLWKPDLILLDVMMPDMDGYEVCEELKNNKETKGIPIIFLTALSETGSEYKGLELGAIDYISKPVNPDIVKARIKNYLKLKEYSDNLEEQVKLKVREIEKYNESFIETLALIAETRDSDLGRHIERCIEYSKVMLKSMAKQERYKDILDKDTQRIISKAMTLHDIGKIGIQDSILLKKGKLTKEEFEIMKKHSEYGFKILNGALEKLKGKDFEILQYAKDIAYYHHERWNGEGYPKGLKGEEIPFTARIMMVIDVFDAIVSKRIYKEEQSPEEAIEFIKNNSGIMFDPNLVEILLEEKAEFFEIESKYKDYKNV